MDLVLLVGFMRIVSGEFCRTWAGRMLNVHPSLLPKHGGLMDLAVHQAHTPPRRPTRPPMWPACPPEAHTSPLLCNGGPRDLAVHQAGREKKRQGEGRKDTIDETEGER